jgi:hypothetical protein
MRILNKDSYWWKGQEKEWAAQDSSGNWWIYKESQKPTMKTNNKRRKGQTSNRFTTEHYVIFVLACVLGISMALNIITLLMLMS